MRTQPEWIGKTDDSRVPDRVRMRVFLRDRGRCACCNRIILVGEAWELDHLKPLAMGGEHREGNLQPVLREHHRTKTSKEAPVRAKSNRTIKRHIGIKKRSTRPILGSKRSGWKHKIDGSWEKRNGNDK